MEGLHGRRVGSGRFREIVGRIIVVILEKRKERMVGLLNIGHSPRTLTLNLNIIIIIITSPGDLERFQLLGAGYNACLVRELSATAAS